jgi:diguanylate cyclase (GGDEF)-like protein
MALWFGRVTAAAEGRVAGAMNALRAVRAFRPTKFDVLRFLNAPRTRVFVFSSTLAFLGIVALVNIDPGLHDLEPPLSIPWPIFALAYYIAEVKVIDVHFRRDTHSFSLTEVPAVIGLFYVDPHMYVLGIMCGALAALITVRQPRAKLFFNLGYFLLASVLSLGLFHAIARHESPPGPLDWTAAFVAALTMSSVGAVSIATVITLSGKAPQYQRLPQMLQVGALFATTNTSLALLAVAVLWVDPMAIWLVAVPVGTMFLAYRAYLSERQKHESLELLYESSRIFQRSLELDSAILSVLEHARLMFHSDHAEAVVYGPDSMPLRTSTGPGDRTEVMVPAPERASLLARLGANPSSFTFEPSTELPVAGERLYRYAMVSPLRGESGLLGALLVADRIGDSEEFTQEDLRLLETVANQAAVALENGQLEQSLAELSRLKDELRHQAFHDPLTGLANRFLLTQVAEERLAADSGESVPVILFLDLDDFKIINDTIGHGAGDLLLKAFAERLHGCIRSTDLAARLGGDEFGVLLEDGRDLANTDRVAARLMSALQAPFRLSGREFTVAASIGVAAGAPGMAVEDLLRNADVAMYAAKTQGKGQLAVWDPRMHRAVIERHELSTDLSRAINRDELQVHYQPLVALGDGVVVGFEALVRWNHPTKGAVPPDQFIILAEESGAIVSLGHSVLNQACREAVDWRTVPGLADASVSVNLSPQQIGRPEFVDEVREILDSTGLEPQRLVLEMTETAMFRDMDGAIQKLQALRRVGVRLAVDDFGNGYSSLGYLRRFPVDELKIPREFLGSSADDAEQWAFAHAIVALGKTLGLTIVGEGIENVDQRDRLRELGCDIGQGYLFSKAVPPAKIPALVRTLNRQVSQTSGPKGRRRTPPRIALEPAPRAVG